MALPRHARAPSWNCGKLASRWSIWNAYKRCWRRCSTPSTVCAPHPSTLTANRRGQPDLWGFGISGDFPILLATIEDEDGLELVKELIQAHIYWRRRGLLIDLVVLNERAEGYNQELLGQLHRLLAQMHSEIWLNRARRHLLAECRAVAAGGPCPAGKRCPCRAGGWRAEP